MRKDDQPRVPRSLFDRPSAALRRDAKQLVKLKQQGMSRLFKPALPSSASSRPLLGDAPEHPDWLIHEDWALLQVCGGVPICVCERGGGVKVISTIYSCLGGIRIK